MNNTKLSKTYINSNTLMICGKTYFQFLLSVSTYPTIHYKSIHFESPFYPLKRYPLLLHLFTLSVPPGPFKSMFIRLLLYIKGSRVFSSSDICIFHFTLHLYLTFLLHPTVSYTPLSNLDNWQIRKKKKIILILRLDILTHPSSVTLPTLSSFLDISYRPMSSFNQW